MWYNDKLIAVLNHYNKQSRRGGQDNVDITEDDDDCRHFHEMIEENYQHAHAQWCRPTADIDIFCYFI